MSIADTSPQTKTVTICDADRGFCQVKEIAAHIDVEATMSGHCELRDIELPDGSIAYGVIVCNG